MCSVQVCEQQEKEPQRKEDNEATPKQAEENKKLCLYKLLLVLTDGNTKSAAVETRIYQIKIK